LDPTVVAIARHHLTAHAHHHARRLFDASTGTDTDAMTAPSEVAVGSLTERKRGRTLTQEPTANCRHPGGWPMDGRGRKRLRLTGTHTRPGRCRHSLERNWKLTGLTQPTQR
jgi:hypothetical protein